MSTIVTLSGMLNAFDAKNIEAFENGVADLPLWFCMLMKVAKIQPSPATNAEAIELRIKGKSVIPADMAKSSSEIIK